jgi:hypothetical protein
MKLRFALLLALLVPVLLSAAPRTDTFTGEALDRHALRGHATGYLAKLAGYPVPTAILQDTSYAVIRRSALADITATTRRTLIRTYGVNVTLDNAGWNKRWNCEAFALAWTLELRARLMRELWHASSPVTRPAAYLFAYRVRGDGRGHCLIYLQTDEGPVILDPIIGPVQLSESEARSIWLPSL